MSQAVLVNWLSPADAKYCFCRQTVPKDIAPRDRAVVFISLSHFSCLLNHFSVLGKCEQAGLLWKLLLLFFFPETEWKVPFQYVNTVGRHVSSVISSVFHLFINPPHPTTEKLLTCLRKHTSQNQTWFTFSTLFFMLKNIFLKEVLERLNSSYYFILFVTCPSTLHLIISIFFPHEMQ